MAGEQFLIFGIAIFDTAIAGQVGVDELSALTVVLRWVQFTSVIFSIVAVGGSILVAQAIGERNISLANHTVLGTLQFALLVGLITTLVAIIGSAFFIGLIGVDEDVHILSTQYLRWMALSFVPSFMLFSANGCLRGAGDGRTPFLVMSLANLLHAGIALLLVFAFNLGLTGLAWSTFLSRSAGLAIVVLLLYRGITGLRLQQFRWQWTPMRQIWRVGRAVGGEQLALRLGQIVNLRLVSLLGTGMIASYAIVLNTLGIILLIGLGFMNVALTVIGQQIGASEHHFVYGTMRRITLLAWLVMGSLALVFFIYPQVNNLFSNDAGTLDRATLGLRIVLLGIPFEVMNQVLTGALRGSGDTRYPMLVTTFGHLIVRLPLILLLTVYFDFGLNGIFLAMVFEMAVRSILNIHRVRDRLRFPSMQSGASAI